MGGSLTHWLLEVGKFSIFDESDKDDADKAAVSFVVILR